MFYTVNGEKNKSSVEFRKVLNGDNDLLFPTDAIFLTDKKVYKLYKYFFNGKKTIVIANGEKNKEISTVLDIIDKLVEYRADRNCFLVGVGGGVVTDIAGFVASVYMRGIQFGFIPTTLLAMIDASIGGKNGVNHKKYKNMIGTFNQPDFIYIDHSFLKSLSIEEYTNGMAEAIKHMLITDEIAFNNFNDNIEEYKNPGSVLIPEFLQNQAKVKIDIVNQDEKEKGIRSILNFGHTFGHAIEKIYKLKHGFAISLGMVIASEISQKLGMIAPKQVIEIKECLEKCRIAC
ncbi:MAG: 3-dehydroquinate synthase family protein [Saprospiraceae bacterium]